MKFKKHISLFLTFFLLVSNMGLALNVHYCGDKIASVSPVYWNTFSDVRNNEKGCCCSFSEAANSCCKNKVVDFQKKSDDFVVKSFFFNLGIYFLVPEWIPVAFSSTPNFKICPITSYFCDANAPPFFKLYHQYIFYA